MSNKSSWINFQLKEDKIIDKYQQKREENNQTEGEFNRDKNM